MTYLIFETGLSSKDGKIKSWAPIENPHTKTRKFYWTNVSKIKKGDILYFITDSYLYAKGIAIEDAIEVSHQVFYDNDFKQDNWSEMGYGVISKIIADYSLNEIRIIDEMTEQNYQIEESETHYFPFCRRNGAFSAQQGGYCFEIYPKLISFIETCIIKKRKDMLANWALSYQYEEISMQKVPQKYGTNKIGEKKEKKGIIGETGVYNFFAGLGFSVKNVANDTYYSADLIVVDQDQEYNIEVKNITTEEKEKSIYLSDSQLTNLFLEKTYLCLYYKKNVFLLDPMKQKLWVKNVISNINQIRKKVIEDYGGCYQISDISILVTPEIIISYFLDITFCDFKDIQTKFKRE